MLDRCLRLFPAPAAAFRPAPTEFTLSGIDRGHLSVVPTPDAPMERALQVETTQPGEFPWEPQIAAPIPFPVRKDDVLLAVFRVRNPNAADGADARTALVVERAGEPYDKCLEYPVTTAADWTLHFVPLIAHADFAAGAWSLIFRAGEQRQVFEVGDVRLLNFARAVQYAELPRVKPTYAGIEPDAPWRAEAARRIERLRKGDLTIEVTDADGRPLEGVEVRIEMTRHAFRFGSAVNLHVIADHDRPENAVYVRHILELFNHVVNENDLKWPCWETDNARPFSKAKSRTALQWLKANDFTLKGHCVVWPSWQWTPKRLKALAKDPVALRAAVESHIDDLVSATGPWVDEWDVINEPWNNNDLIKALGDEVMIEWFQRVRARDPDARLYLNDFGILAAGGLTDTPHQAHFERTIRFLLDGGAPLTGLGMQSHFGENVTPPETVWRILDRYAAFGLPIQITEFDVNSNDEAFQAAYLRDFMTAVFAHEAVNGFVMWGFWEGAHWRPDAALFRKDWTIKPNGEEYRRLVFDEWWTRETRTTDARGRAATRGFLGRYRVTARRGGAESATEITLLREGATVRLTLDAARSLRPRFRDPAVFVHEHRSRRPLPWNGDRRSLR